MRACHVRCPRHRTANRLVAQRATDILRAGYSRLRHFAARDWRGCTCNLMARVDALLAEKR